MRATNGASRHKMIKRLMKRASGFQSGRHKMYRVACEAVKRAEQQGVFGRKLKKRQFRALWIKRISIACREQGITYSRLINALQRLDIRLDRKQLSELAVLQPQAFAEICTKAKSIPAIPVAEGQNPAEFDLKPRKGGKDDITIIEGIGPKIGDLFVANGIDSFAKLAKTSVADLKVILAKAGNKYNMAKPETWPEQAAFAAKGDWASLRNLMDELIGGVRK